LTPSSESRKSVQDGKTPERKKKKLKTKKELFKSLGLEDSSSSSNFNSNLGANSPQTQNMVSEKPVFSFLSSMGSSRKSEKKEDLIRESKDEEEFPACRKSKISNDKHSNSGNEQQPGFKRILNFSPEDLQTRRDGKTERNSKPPTPGKDFVFQKNFPASSLKTFPASNNRSTGRGLKSESKEISKSNFQTRSKSDKSQICGLENITESCKTRAESNLSILASCGLADSPVKNSFGSTTVPKKATKRKRGCLSFSTNVLASCRPDVKEENVAELSLVDVNDKTTLKTKQTNATKTTTFDDVNPITNASLGLSTPNKNLASPLKLNATFHDGEKMKVQKPSSKLPTPQKKLASTLGLDLSSSDDDGDGDAPKLQKFQSSLKSRDCQNNSSKSPPKKTLPKHIDEEVKAEQEDVFAPPKKKKKVQLGLSTKENRIDFVYQT